MSTRRARLLLLPLMLAAAAAFSVARASADIIITPIDFCAVAPANDHVNIAPGVAGGFFFNSVDAAYANSACGRYVLDAYVPTNTTNGFSAGLGSPPYSGLPDPIPQSTCTALTESLTYYRRGIYQTSFTVVKKGVLKGTWIANGNPPHCAMTQTSGDPGLPGYEGPVTAGPFGAAVVRIAVAVRKASFGQTVPVPVHVDGSFHYGV